MSNQNQFEFDDSENDAPFADEVRHSRLSAVDAPASDKRKNSDVYFETGNWRQRVGGFVAENMAYDKRKGRPLSYSTLDISNEERLWAGIAHGSVAFTLLTGLLSGGFVVPFSIMLPLVLYFVFRTRSDYVAFHAMQSFVLALSGTVGLLLLFIVGSITWVVGLIVALLLMLVLVGFILVPLWLIVGVVLGLAGSVLPIGIFILSLIAAFETYNGRDYRYPFIAPWVDRQFSEGFMRG